MTALAVRRIRFDFSDGVDFLWNPNDPMFSLQMNATSIIAIGFEKLIVAATREALPKITDPDVASEAEAFLRQEAQHANAHRQHMRALIERYPGLQQTLDEVIASYDKLTRGRSLRYRLGYIADLEASFTPNFKVMLDHQEELFRPGDERVASLFLWHFVEEVEHRSSALVVYDAVVGRPVYRLTVLPSVLKHLGSILGIIAEGFNAHVPLADRQVDARYMVPWFATKAALRAKFANRKGGQEQAAPLPSRSLPKDERREAFRRIIKSQAPKHDPEHQPLPAFVDRWTASYEAGHDASRWYSSEHASA